MKAEMAKREKGDQRERMEMKLEEALTSTIHDVRTIGGVVSKGAQKMCCACYYAAHIR
jgi:hypothetical protein